MRRLETLENPTVLNQRVQFRDKNGRFTKPHLAAFVEFKVPGSRQVSQYFFPPGRKTKAYALEFAKGAYLFEAKELAAKKLKREEARRKKLPPPPKPKKVKGKKTPKFVVPKITIEKTFTTAFSKRLQENLEINGYNHIFKHKVLVEPSNVEEVMEMLRGMLTTSPVKIFKKHKLSGKRMYLRIFGEGDYQRTVDGRKKKDQLGFSVSRHQVFSPDDVKMYADLVVDEFKEAFRPKVGKTKGLEGYFMLKVKDSDYYITGYRVEWIETLDF